VQVEQVQQVQVQPAETTGAEGGDDEGKNE